MKVIEKLWNWYLSANALPYWVILAIDIFICYFSGLFVFWLYSHGALVWSYIALFSKTILIYMIFNLIGFRIFHTYSGIIRYSSFVDLQRVGLAMLSSLIVAEAMHYVIYYWDLDFIRLQGRQIAAMYLVATIGMISFRIVVKSLYDVVFSTDNAMRTLIYGVNGGGIGLAKSIRIVKPQKFALKGFIAHDSSFKGRILMGQKVYMVDDDLAEHIKSLKIKAVLVSPLQNERFRDDQKLQDILLSQGVQIFMSEGEKEWSQDDDYSNVQLKEISIEDLLPRDQIRVDMDSIGALLRGKKIMITGSAGSIGSEMVRQIAIYNPAELILIDQAETPQHNIRLMMHFEWPNITAHTIVASIANADRMDKIFQTYKPDYVFHAAAYNDGE